MLFAHGPRLLQLVGSGFVNRVTQRNFRAILAPQHLLYSKSHEWTQVEQNTATIGVTEFEQEKLGDIETVHLPQVGASVKQGQPFASVESNKALSSISSPVTGTVVEVNISLKEHPEKVNSDPFGEGWLARVKLVERATLDHLMNSEGYRDWCRWCAGPRHFP